MSQTTTPTPVTTGNTIMSPPRLSGDAEADTRTMQRWLQDLYDQFAKVSNVIGTLNALTAQVAQAQDDIVAIKKFVGM